jgi:hypothetical protein
MQDEAINTDHDQNPASPCSVGDKVKTRVEYDGLSSDHHTPADPYDYGICDIVSAHALVDVIELEEHAQPVEKDPPCRYQ